LITDTPVYSIQDIEILLQVGCTILGKGLSKNKTP